MPVQLLKELRRNNGSVGTEIQAGLDPSITLNLCMSNVIHMRREGVLSIRIEPRLKREVELLSKVLHISPSEWIRTQLAKEVKEFSDKMKSQIVIEYMKGNITKKELSEVFGNKLTTDIDFIIDEVKREFKLSKQLAKQLKEQR